jgi:spore coat protein JA
MVVKKYVLPPPVFFKFQPMEAQQFTPEAALMQGTLWPMLADGFFREEGIS